MVDRKGKKFNLLSLTPCPGGFSGVHERLCLYKACDFRVPTSHPKEGKPISSAMQVQTLYALLIISESSSHGLAQGRGLGPNNPMGLPRLCQLRQHTSESAPGPFCLAPEATPRFLATSQSSSVLTHKTLQLK